MGRAHGSAKQQQERPSSQHAIATPSAAAAPGSRAFGSGIASGSKASAPASSGKRSLFDDEGGGDDMFFDAKKGSERKSARRPAAKGEQEEEEEEEEVKLEVNKAFADKFAAVERLKDGMRLKSLEEQYAMSLFLQ
jgi:hypothetical protein